MKLISQVISALFVFTSAAFACESGICVGDKVILTEFENRLGEVTQVVPGEPEAQIFATMGATPQTVVTSAGVTHSISGLANMGFAIQFQTTISKVERVCEGGPCDRILTAQQLAKLNDELLLPTESSIVLPKELVIPRGGNGCGTVSSVNGHIRCGVCQPQRSRDDISYSARTLIIEDNAVTKDGKELVFNIRKDPDGLQTVKCQSRDVFNVKTIQDLKALLSKHNLELNLGGMIRK